MLTIGLDVGASFHVAALLGPDDHPEDWKKLATIRVTLDRQGFEGLAQAVENRLRGPGTPGFVTENEEIGRSGRTDPDTILGTTSGAVRVAIEPTGRFYSEAIARWCEGQGWHVHWVDNKTLHDYRTMMRAPSKSDAMDARLLAHYLHHNHHTGSQGDKYAKHLRYLVQELGHLNKARTQYKNRLRQVLKVTFPELEIGDGRGVLALLEHAPSVEQMAGLPADEIRHFVRGSARAEALRTLAQTSIGCNERLYGNRVTHAVRMIRTLDERITLLEADIEYLVQEHPDGAACRAWDRRMRRRSSAATATLAGTTAAACSSASWAWPPTSARAAPVYTAHS